MKSIKEQGDSIDPADPKVIIGKDSSKLEITPFSSFNNGLLIQPVNRATNSGISTAFYTGDTASWSFFTNSQKRLTIAGTGYISTSVPLLINNAKTDGKSALRVNGQARVDSTFWFQAASDSNSFISMNRNVKNVNLASDDGISPYTTTPTAWAISSSVNISALRIRHPLNVSGSSFKNISVQRDFLIVPYQFGMAIEYNGVVECWVGEWSVHRGLAYHDTEGKGNGWGAVLWVGDDNDYGGIRATARNNSQTGGSVKYGELSVERFAGTPNGDFRFRLPSTGDQFQYVYGERGSTNIVAKISDKGFFLPKAGSPGLITAPEKGQVYFDSTAAEFKGYDGNQWTSLSNNLVTGSTILSGKASDTVYLIEHDLGTPPSYFNVIATSAAAAGVSYVTADANYLKIYYSAAPAAGTNNLSWNWEIKK